MNESSSISCDSTLQTPEVFLKNETSNGSKETVTTANNRQETNTCHLSTPETYSDDDYSSAESEGSSAEEKNRQKQASSELNQTCLLELSSLRFRNKTSLNFEDNCLQNSHVEELQNILCKFLAKAQHDISFVKSITVDTCNDKPQKCQIQSLNETCRQLEAQNIQLAGVVKQLQKKLDMHDMKTRQAMTALQKSQEVKIIELKEKCRITETEKQASVTNYARREKELLDLRCQKENAEQVARDAVKDRDKVIAKAQRPDLSKFKNVNEKTENGNILQTKEIDKLKEDINSQVIKVRWAQNKLKAEVESHNETKEKCEKLLLEIQHAKEEAEHLRKNCQEMIKTYQESEEMKSNALDIKLQESINLLSEKEAENEKLQLILKQRSDDLLVLKQKHKDVCNEYQALKSKAASLDQEKVKNLSVLRDYEKIMNTQKATASEMNAKMQEIFDLQTQVEELNAVKRNLEENIEEAISQRNTALNDLVSKERKEQELVYTEKVTSKNTQLTIEIEEVKSKLFSQDDELSIKEKLIENLEDELKKLATTREKEKRDDEDTEKTLNTRLKEKEQTICELLLQLEELKDEMRTKKRKDAALLKDLSRQLDIARKKNGNTDTLIPSSGFIGRDLGVDSGTPTTSTSSDQMPPFTTVQNHSQGLQCQQLLIERIVRLQQTLAAKDEKIDFLNEHVNQLTESLQEKQHLFYHFLLKEKSGTLPPPCADTDLHARYGLTMEEMNKKMQSLLEDTLIKNISLKESLKVLGKEIQRLSSPSSSPQHFCNN